MAETFDIMLLLALPASGKSETRKFLEEESPRDFYMGPTVQLDDYPYVHFLKRIDQVMEPMGQERAFYLADDKPFKDGVTWGILIELLNQDYKQLITKEKSSLENAAKSLFARINSACDALGAPSPLRSYTPAVLDKAADALEAEAMEILKERNDQIPDNLEGKTIVMECARGGPHGASMPLKDHYGYQYSLPLLLPEILEKAVILYIWVSPEESRRKNVERADPNDPGSILAHGVAMEVMMTQYGCDDMDYLISQSDKPHTIKVKTRDKVYYLPVAKFDNRVDKTSFLRKERSVWKPEEIQDIHTALKTACDQLYTTYKG